MNRLPSRFRLLVAALLTVFLCVLLFLAFLPPVMPQALSQANPLADAVVLAILIVPFLILFVLRPLHRAASNEAARAEAALRERDERFDLVARATNDGVWDWNVTTNAVWLNEAVQTLFRYKAEEIGYELAWWEERLHPEDRERVMASLNGVLASAENTWSEEYRFRCGDGTYAFVLDRGYVVRDPGGKALRMLGAMTDITVRKEAEAALARARDAALRSVHLKSQFLANMSHEIRTPMNGVIGMTALLLDTELTEEQREYAEAVRVSGEALLTVINDILDFSKIEAGKLTLESIDLDLRAIVEDVADLLAGRAEAKGLEMTCLVDGSVPEVVSGDPGRVRQILTNLVGNAVKFTGAGEVVVRLACAAEGPSDATVRFEVIDTGIGIDADAQADLFQAFSQGDGSTTRRYGGTGLGLAISKQLVELMGGEIGVVSAPGRGSTFWFTARFARRPARVDAPSAAAVAPLSGMRVLCADDNATSRVALARQMSAWGMAVDCAVDGPSALARLRSAREAGDPYRVVLVDHTMPGLDGFGLAGEVAGDAALAGTALVLLTPWAQRGSGAAAQEAGFAACVAKPVRRAQLLAGLVAAVRGDALAVRASAERPARRAGAAAVAPPAASAAPTPRADGPRVLIADDNIVSQKVTAKILEKLGYRADVVPNGIEAIEAASGGAYDVVLMDCQMPDVDGYQATAEIRRREGARSHTAIIAMTASALHGERERCLAAGMDGYISKPVHPQELRDEVERWVRAGSARARRSAPGA